MLKEVDKGGRVGWKDTRKILGIRKKDEKK